jgi:hypothetical protein
MSVLKSTWPNPVVDCDLKHGFFQHHSGIGKCYHLQEQVNQSWQDAATYCRNLGSELATIDNTREMNLLQDVMGSLGEDILVYGHLVYLGISRQVCNTESIHVEIWNTGSEKKVGS